MIDYTNAIEIRPNFADFNTGRYYFQIFKKMYLEIWEEINMQP